MTPARRSTPASTLSSAGGIKWATHHGVSPNLRPGHSERQSRLCITRLRFDFDLMESAYTPRWRR
jgi:hypothetical protein